MRQNKIIKIFLLGFIIAFSGDVICSNVSAKGYFESKLRREFDSIFSNIIEVQYSDIGATNIAIERMYSIAKELNTPIDLEVKAIYRDISTKYTDGRVSPNTIVNINRLINEIDTVSNKFEYGLLILTNSKINFLSDDYADAFSDGLIGLNLFSSICNEEFIAAANILLGNVLAVIGEHRDADMFYQKAIEYYKNNGDIYRAYTTKLNSFNSEFVFKDKKKILSEVKTEVNDIKKYGNKALVAMGYINIGFKYTMLGNNKEAKEYYLKSLELSNTFDNENVTLLAKYNLAGCYFIENEHEMAYNIYKEAEKNYTNCGENRKLMQSYLGLSNVFAATERYDSAYLYSIRYDSIRELIMGSIKIAEVQRLKAKDALSEYKVKLQLAENSALLHKKQMWITLLIAIGVILSIVLVLIVVLSKKRLLEEQAKIREIENQKLQEKRESEEKLTQLKTDKLMSEINSKNREISSSLLLLSSKNEILKKVIAMTEECKSDDPVFKTYKANISDVVKNSIKIDDEWKFFKLHFDKVHPDFFRRLKQDCKQLTENDLRLCAYIKIGMNSKHISQMLAITVNSVNITRYKIKKKLELNEDIGLDDYIRNM